MANLTNQRQVFVKEYVRSGDYLDASNKAGYKTLKLCLIRLLRFAESDLV